VTSPLTVTVAGVAGIHALDLARQLSAKGALAAYYTALPRSRTRGVPPRLVHRHLALLLPLYAGMRGWLPISQTHLYRLVDREFDRWISRRIVQADVVHAVAGVGLYHRRAARQRFGALTVCDSPTTHVRYQQALLTAEHAKWGAAPIDWDESKITSIEEEYAESDLILVASQFAYQSFVTRGIPESKLALVPYGVDCDEYTPMPKADDIFRILFVGTLSIRKGLPYLLDAVAQLRWPNAELSLRGEQAPESGELLRRYRGTIPIRVVPRQPRALLKHLYSSASLLVLPSIEDGFGLVIGQALACGIPVIASANTGGPDVIEDGVTGFIIPPGDRTALQIALTNAYENRAMLTRMGAEARRRVERARGWGEYGDRIIDALAGAVRKEAGQDRRRVV
jgi:starch synthase